MHNVRTVLWCCLGLLGLMVLVAGCGGGGDSSGNQLGGNTVTVTFTDNSGNVTNPAYLAYQDGSGIWVKQDLVSSGRYTFMVTNAAKKYGIAVVESSGDSGTQIMYGTTNELTNIPYTIDTGESTGDCTISGSVSGATNGFDASCNQKYPYYDSSAHTYYISGVHAGAHPLIADNTNFLASVIPTRMWIKNLNVSGDMTQNIDFFDSNSFALGTKTVQLPTGWSGLVFFYLSEEAFQYLGLSSSVNNSVTYATIPSNKMPSAGLYEYGIGCANGFYTGYSKSPRTSFSDVTFPTIDSTITTSGTSMTWTKCPNATLYQTEITDDNSYVDMTITPNWLGTTASVAIPTGLASLDGWGQYLPSSTTYYTVYAYITNCSLNQYYNGEPYDGLSIMEVDYTGNIDALKSNTKALSSTDRMKNKEIHTLMNPFHFKIHH
ncbi:MAG TPA: hypothetical protein VHV83_19315 [Armatimonadota bacterium]|nr:hypothetical protein [Armatimonadota bacterium]